MGVRGRGKGARRKVRARWPRLHSLHINTHSVEEGEETFLEQPERERERTGSAPWYILYWEESFSSMDL